MCVTIRYIGPAPRAGRYFTDDYDVKRCGECASIPWRLLHAALRRDVNARYVNESNVSTLISMKPGSNVGVNRLRHVCGPPALLGLKTKALNKMLEVPGPPSEATRRTGIGKPSP